MPYIPKSERADYDEDLGELIYELRAQGWKPGHLNYVITTLMVSRLDDKMNYDNINELVGVLECTKLELYRALVGHYEDSKIRTNGLVEPK
jgi:hypothetical protein